MKKTVILFIFLFAIINIFAQNNPAPQPRGITTPFVELDTLTTVQRDALVIPGNKTRFIYNSTVDLLQYYNLASSSWQDVGSGGVTDHTLLTNIGTNTHAQIDTHVADATLHYTKNDIDLWQLGDVVTNAVTANEILSWTGTQWENKTAAELGLAVSTFQNVYDNSITTPDILTDNTGGSLTIRAGIGRDANDLIEFQNDAGVGRFSVRGNGLVQSYNTIESTGFIKTGRTDADVLLAGGGHASLSGLGTPAITDNQIVVGTGTGIEGTTELTYNGTSLSLSNATPRVSVNNTGNFRSSALWSDNIIFSRDGFNLTLQTPTLTGNFTANFPALTANSIFAMEADATGFNGNLATTDNTLQEIAQKVDDLVLGGGLSNIVEDLTPQLGANLDLNGFLLTNGVTSDGLQIRNGGFNDVYVNKANGLISNNYLRIVNNNNIANYGSFSGLSLAGAAHVWTVPSKSGTVALLSDITGGSTTFTGLTDTPANFTAQGSKFLRVNSGATALEFTSDLFEVYSDSPITPIFWAGTQVQHDAKFGGGYVHPSTDFIIITDATPPALTSSDITDFDTEVSNNASVVANTAKVSYTDASKVSNITVTQAVNLDTMESDITTNNSKVSNATHTGDVTGDGVLTIAASSVDIAMLSATGTPSASTYLKGDNTWASANEVIQIACSDLVTDITTGISKAYFRMPYAMTLTDVRCSLLDAGTVTGVTIDINETGTSILSTKLTTDATEETSETATAPAVISDSNLADDAKITIDFDVVPTSGLGVIITLIGTRI